MNEKMTWEESIVWLKMQQDQKDLVSLCYYDDPIEDAANRFMASREWAATRCLLPNKPGRLLEIGAGRGISSCAFAQAGWAVTALEPDGGCIVGRGAIHELAQKMGVFVNAIDGTGEHIAIDSNTFDVVYVRAVLHHANNLPKLCSEIGRVLKKGGCFLACREPVIDRPEDLDEVLKNHPLHKLFGGENAFLLSDYLSALHAGGFAQVRVLGFYDTEINRYGNMTFNQFWSSCCEPLCRIFGTRMTRVLTSQRHVAGRLLLAVLARRCSARSRVPGRPVTFVARKEY